MATKLTPEQRSEIAANQGEPVPVVDYIIGESRLSHLESVAADQNEASLARIRRFIAEGDNSPDREASVVHAEIRARAENIDAQSP